MTARMIGDHQSCTLWESSRARHPSGAYRGTPCRHAPGREALGRLHPRQLLVQGAHDDLVGFHRTLHGAGQMDNGYPQQSRTALVDRSSGVRYAPPPAMTAEELLAELRSSPTDLARVVEAVVSRELPYVLGPSAALKGWQERDPDAWRKVEAWLIASGKNVVEV